MSDNNLLTDLETYIHEKVKEGFDDRESIIESAITHLCDEEEHLVEALEPSIEGIVDRMLYQHYQEQQTWLEPTDCDRLDQAFDTLNRNGIVARQNFSCCKTCGLFEMKEIVQELNTKAYPARGYIFYDMQDTEHAVQNRGLYLCYGVAFSTNPNDSIAIGYEVKAVLEAVGFAVDWDGDLNKHIRLSIHWQRRRSIDPSWLNLPL